MERVIVEKTASRGIAVEPVYLYLEPDLTPDSHTIDAGQAQEEISRFCDARASVIAELEELAKKNEIFAAHLEIAGDFTLQDGEEGKINGEQKNAQQATNEVVEEFAAIFDAMDDDYMRERAADIKDIGKRLMAALKGVKRPDLGGLTEPVVVVARDMYPSDTVKIDPSLVKGIITDKEARKLQVGGEVLAFVW